MGQPNDNGGTPWADQRWEQSYGAAPAEPEPQAPPEPEPLEAPA